MSRHRQPPMAYLHGLSAPHRSQDIAYLQDASAPHFFISWNEAQLVSTDWLLRLQGQRPRAICITWRWLPRKFHCFARATFCLKDLRAFTNSVWRWLVMWDGVDKTREKSSEGICLLCFLSFFLFIYIFFYFLLLSIKKKKFLERLAREIFFFFFFPADLICRWRD